MYLIKLSKYNRLHLTRWAWSMTFTPELRDLDLPCGHNTPLLVALYTKSLMHNKSTAQIIVFHVRRLAHVGMRFRAQTPVFVEIHLRTGRYNALLSWFQIEDHSLPGRITTCSRIAAKLNLAK